MNEEKEIETMQELINSRFCVGWDDNRGCAYSSDCNNCKERFKKKANDIAWVLKKNGYGNVSEANLKIKDFEHTIDSLHNEVRNLQLQARTQTAKQIFDLLEKLEQEGRAVLPKGFLQSGRKAYEIVTENTLPHKVGDTLYFVRDGVVIECTILELKFMVNGECKMQIAYITNTPYGNYKTVEEAYMSDIGTRFFADKKQAEGKLRK